jgi:hypothetical protein
MGAVLPRPRSRPAQDRAEHDSPRARLEPVRGHPALDTLHQCGDTRFPHACRLAATRPPLSAVVTTFNESDHITACLESLAWCDEVLVVDSFSTDDTVSIARRFRNVKVLLRPYFGAASQKNWAMDRVSHDWVLFLDADERITPELRIEIEHALATSNGTRAHAIRRRTFFLGRLIKYSGWQHDRVIRLVRRDAARYPNRRVHADMMTAEPAHVLNHFMLHFMVDDLSEYTRRLQRYALWGAAQMWREGRRAGPYEVLVRPLWRFIRTFVVQGGFLDRMPGLVLCLLHAYSTFLKWSILWSWHDDAARGIQPNLPSFDTDERTWAWPGDGRPFTP